MIYLILILGFILRLISLNQSFWLDESTSGMVVRNFNFTQIVSVFSPGDFHPPLYYLFLKIWSDFFGSGEIALRFPSIIFGLLTIYLTYHIGKNLFDRKTGLIAGLLLATSSLHIYYSQEARMYSLIAFIVTLSVFSFMKILNKSRLGDWILFSVFLLLIAASDYVALLIIPVFWIMGIIYKKNLKWYLKLLTSHIILFVFAFLWFPIFLKQATVGISLNISSPSWQNLLGTFSFKNLFLIPVKFILGRISFDNNLLYAFIAVFSVLLFGAIVTLSLKNFKKLLIIWLWLVIPIILGVLISFKLSILSYFRFLFCIPAFYLLASFGITELKPKLSNIFLVILVLTNIAFSGIYLFNPRFHREDWRGLTSFIKEETKDNKSIVLFVADSNMEGFRYYDSDANISGPGGFNTKYDEIYLLRYLQTVFDQKDLLRAKIEASGYNKSKEYDFNGIVVWKYLNENSN